MKPYLLRPGTANTPLAGDHAITASHDAAGTPWSQAQRESLTHRAGPPCGHEHADAVARMDARQRWMPLGSRKSPKVRLRHPTSIQWRRRRGEAGRGIQWHLQQNNGGLQSIGHAAAKK